MSSPPPSAAHTAPRLAPSCRRFADFGTNKRGRKAIKALNCNSALEGGRRSIQSSLPRVGDCHCSTESHKGTPKRGIVKQKPCWARGLAAGLSHAFPRFQIVSMETGTGQTPTGKGRFSLPGGWNKKRFQILYLRVWKRKRAGRVHHGRQLIARIVRFKSGANCDKPVTCLAIY